MAFHSHLSPEMALPPYAEQQLGEGPAVLTTSDKAVRKASGGGGGGPSWLSSAVLRQQGQHFGADGSFLHLQTASDSTASPVSSAGGARWLPRPQMRGSDEENPVSGESMIAAAMSHTGRGGGSSVQGGGAEEGEAEAAAAGEGTWQNARYKAEILAHPLYEQLLAAHVAYQAGGPALPYRRAACPVPARCRQILHARRCRQHRRQGA